MSAPAAPALPAEVWITAVTHPDGGVCLNASADRDVAEIGVVTWNESDVDAEAGWSLKASAARYVLASAFDAIVQAEVERRLALRGAAE